MRMLTSILCLLLLAPAAVLAQQPETLTLEQAKQFALERNINVIQTQNNLDAAKSSLMSAWGRYLPRVSASSDWRRSQQEGPIYSQGIPIPGSSLSSTSSSWSAGLNANLTIFDGFDREANLSRVQSTVASNEQTVARTRQSIVYQVEAGYLNVLRSEQLVKVSEENLKRDLRQLERIVESNRVGAQSLADVYRQQTQVANDEVSLINAQNNFGKAKADLIALAGLDAAQEYVIADATLSTTFDTTETATVRSKYDEMGGVAGLTKRALNTRPDYLGAKHSLSASEEGVVSARSDYFPSLSAFAGLNTSSEELKRLFEFKTMSWGFSLSWTLFDGFNREATMQSAVASRRNAEINVVQTERNISVDVKKALLDLDAAAKQLEASDKGLRSAVEDRKIAEEKYNLGAGTLLDLLTANAGLVNAEANKVNASYNYIIAKRNVEYVLGERSY